MTKRDDIAGRKERLSAAKGELLARLGRGATATRGRPEIPRLADRDDPSLSFAQERLWFLEQLRGDATAYNLPFALRLRGSLDVALLERALAEIVARHETLRTTFPAVDGRPVPVVAPPGGFELAKIDLRGAPVEERDGAAAQHRREHGQARFDLERGPLFRAVLIRIADDAWHLVVNVHHIVFDGWSIGVFLRELGALYEAFARGEPSPLDPPEIQYVDFAAWQRESFSGERARKQLAYWEDRLGGAPALRLPADHPRPTLPSFEGESLRLELPADLTEAIEAIGRRERATLSMVLMAAIGVLLARYTGQTDIVLGSAIANRNHHEIEGLIGFFVNNLVTRTDCSGDPTFQQLLRRVRHEMLSAYEHQDLPFEKLVAHLNPERDPSHNPLFQVVLQVQNTPSRPRAIPGLEVTRLPEAPRTARVDLEVHAGKDDGELVIMFTYGADLFDAGTIEQMSRHFRAILEAVAARPETRLSALPILSEAEERRQVVEWNRTDRPYPADACIHALVEERAASAPDAIALVHGAQQLDYAALNARSNQLAHTLRAMGVGPGVLVGLCVERGIDMVVGLLGILKAGGAYLPLDPAYPRSRLAYMLEDSGAPVLLTQSGLLEELPAHEATVLSLDRDWPRIAEAPSTNPAGLTTPDDLAYAIYTSGSTGQPKGALLAHRGLCNVSEAQARAFGVTSASRVLQFSSLSFDASTFEIVMALPNGATLVLGDREDLMPGPDLAGFLRRHAVSIVTLPPSALGACPVETLPDLATITVAGEACPAELVARWAPGRRFFNLYGPTETTIWATMAELRDGDAPSIGRPIANTQVYVVDGQLRPVPAGAPGELCIGGLGLARGYHARPALTAERFVPNPFGDVPGARLYRTGDLARHRADGTIDFLGRIDHQVKLRGFRIELGEIEEVLAQNPLVRDAVVTSHHGAAGSDELVAYIAPDRDASEAQAGEHVGQWQSLYDETYGEQVEPDDPTFNIAGWNSSYTGEPIPAPEMREWVDGAVSRVLAAQPRQVLEIGCGSGLLLFRIAPHCAAYVGADFSQAALDYVSGHLEGRGLSPKVQLRRQAADDFTGLEPGSFDTVILNSVVQYFPGVAYLLSVLDGATRLVKPGGRIFVGDVRSLPLLSAHHASVQLFRSDDETAAVDLRRRTHRLLAQEEELVVDPALFLALAQRRDAISHVEIRPKRGRGLNELSKFRYDVTLHVGGTVPEPLDESSDAWSGHGLGVTGLRERLESERPRVVTLRGVPNPRTAGDAAAASMVLDGEEASTAGLIRQRSAPASQDGVDPEAMCELGEAMGYRVDLSWANAGTDGRYDALLTREVAPAGAAMPAPRIAVHPWTSYANSPVQSKLTRQLAPALREYLETRLPQHMIPSAFVMLEALPLTPNGKVDRSALPEPEWYRSQAATSYEAPRTPTETDLAAIWGALLGVDRVGIRDDFFELGGHSLLATQVVSRVRETMGVDLPVAELFASSTVASLAEEIETLRWAANGEAPADEPAREVEEGAI